MLINELFSLYSNDGSSPSLGHKDAGAIDSKPAGLLAVTVSAAPAVSMADNITNLLRAYIASNKYTMEVCISDIW